MKTLMGVVYDANTLVVRRIIVPDDDSELRGGNHLGQGEAMTTAPLSEGVSLTAAINAVMRKIKP